jgi:hypothetical protein
VLPSTNSAEDDRVDRLLSLSGERFDRLMTVEARPMSGGLPAGLVVPMYEACREFHGEPLSTLAARKLIARVNDGDTVLIATGAGVPPNLPFGETDGPPGAAVLARALATGLGANTVLLCEPPHLGAVSAVAELIQGTLSDRGSIAAKALAPGSPKEGESVSPMIAALYDHYRPAAIIFVELDGPNREGFFHGVRGDRRPLEMVARLHHLASLAHARGVLTIGIGDGGNEVGFGAVREKVAESHPNGLVVTTAATDVTVSASVSNWGAYAVAAAIAVALQNLDLLHRPELELALISACIAAGARDGATSSTDLAVDGISWWGHASFVGLLRSIVASAVPNSMERLKQPARETSRAQF